MKKQEVIDTVNKVVSSFGTVDILVNAAGIVRLGHAVDISEEDWDAVMAVNVKGALFFCQEAGKVMMNKKNKLELVVGYSKINSSCFTLKVNTQNGLDKLLNLFIFSSFWSVRWYPL
jgi:NAD(P)-dependent dehydrogenase (short-subunit alcohol dehydrogenase family)